MTEPKDLPAFTDVRFYQVLCVTALGMIFLVLGQQGFVLENWLLVAVGLLGTWLCLRVTPVLVIVVLAGIYLMRQLTWGRFGLRAAAFQLPDVILCAAVLAFVLGHYRLQGLTHTVVPLDPRRRRQRRWAWLRPANWQEKPRASTGVSPSEMARLFLTLPLCALLAQVFWLSLGRHWEFLGMAEHFSRLLLAGWVLVLPPLLVKVCLGFWRHRQLTAAEAAMFLQDTLWAETRREQRRLQRWLSWRRLHTKEKT